MLTKKVTFYELLGVGADDPPEKIKAIYRLRTLDAHPREPGSGDEELQKALNRAYAVLKDPEKRREYNERLGVPLNPRSPKPGKPVYEEIQINKNSHQASQVDFNFSRWEPCGRCWGEGCRRCRGKGKILEAVNLTVNVPAGATQVLIEGQGTITEPGGTRGDLILYVVWV